MTTNRNNSDNQNNNSNPGRGRRRRQGRRTDGAVSQLPSGRWRARVTDPTGDRISIGTYESERDALAAIQRHHGTVALGGYVPRERLETPLAVVWRDMLTGLGGEPATVRDRSWFAANVMVDRRADAPRAAVNLGHLPVGSLTESTVTRWVGACVEAGIAPTTISKWAGMILRTTAYGAREAWITRDPLVGRRREILRQVARPKATHYLFQLAEIPVLTWATVPDHSLMWEVLIWSGMRQGEVRALTARAVDVERRRVRVEHNVARDASGRPVLAPTKTHGSTRVVALPGPVFDRLAVLAAEATDPGAPLFPSPDGGWLDGHWLSQQHRRAGTRAGLVGDPADPLPGRRDQPSPHDHRSTVASWLFAAGAPVPNVMAHLGHASGQLTLDVYTEVQDWLSTDDAFRACRMEGLSIPEILDRLYDAAWGRGPGVAGGFDADPVVPGNRGGRPKRVAGEPWATGDRTRRR